MLAKRFRPGSGKLLDRNHLGQTEVQNLGIAAFGHEDVRWFDVAVDNTLLVRRFECVRHLDGDFNHPVDGKGVSLNQVLQCFAVHELHGDERTPAFLGDLIDRADIGMVQRRSSTRLAPEALQRSAVVGEVIGEELERYRPVKQRIFCLVHHTHAPAADLL